MLTRSCLLALQWLRRIIISEIISNAERHRFFSQTGLEPGISCLQTVSWIPFCHFPIKFLPFPTWYHSAALEGNAQSRKVYCNIVITCREAFATCPREDVTSANAKSSGSTNCTRLNRYASRSRWSSLERWDYNWTEFENPHETISKLIKIYTSFYRVINSKTTCTLTRQRLYRRCLHRIGIMASIGHRKLCRCEQVNFLQISFFKSYPQFYNIPK